MWYLTIFELSPLQPKYNSPGKLKKLFIKEQWVPQISACFRFDNTIINTASKNRKSNKYSSKHFLSSHACLSQRCCGATEWPVWGRVYLGPGSAVLLPQAEQTSFCCSLSQSLQASSFSVLISSDLLLAHNNGNKELHAFWHVCGFFFSPLIFHLKEKDREGKMSPLFYRPLLFQKGKKLRQKNRRHFLHARLHIFFSRRPNWIYSGHHWVCKDSLWNS